MSFFVCLLLVNGCGDGKARRYGISGSVYYQERPLDEGSILFISESPELSESGARIRQGKYVVPKGHGLAPGTYEVRITSGERGTDIRKEMDPEQAGGEPYLIARERIPERYNKKSKLTIEVKDGRPFTFKGETRARVREMLKRLGVLSIMASDPFVFF